MQEWYLGRQKVSLLERCPQFRGVLIEGFHCTHYKSMSIIMHMLLVSCRVCSLVSSSLSHYVELVQSPLSAVLSIAGQTYTVSA